MCSVFDGDDAGYLDWLAENQRGFVLNCVVDGTRKLHRTNCRCISNAGHNQHLTVNGVKVCASQATTLDNRCIKRQEAVPDRCRICTPPNADAAFPADRDQTTAPPDGSAVQKRPERPAKPEPKSSTARTCSDEDQLKKTLEEHLKSLGWTVKVAWGHKRGVDLLATRDGRSWFIEVKGSGRKKVRLNFFLAALGELVTRMADRNAKYSVAFPDLPDYRSMWHRRIPKRVLQLLNLTALFIRGRTIEEVGISNL